MRSNTRGFIDVGITASVLALLAIPLAFADASGQCPPANSAWPPCRAPVSGEGISIRDATIIVSGTPSAPVFRYKSCLLNQSDHPVAVTAQVMIFSKDGRKLGSDGQDIGLIAPSRNPKEPGMPLTYPLSVDFSGLPVDARHNLSQTVTVTTQEKGCSLDPSLGQCTRSQFVDVCWYEGDFSHPFTP